MRVYPPLGKVKISAPLRMDLDTIRDFAISKISWIRKQQNRLRNQKVELPKEYISGENHCYLGKEYILNTIGHSAPPKVVLNGKTIEMFTRPNTSIEKRQKILNEWYRKRLKEIIPDLIVQYEKKMDVNVAEFGVKKMKTRWGTCNIKVKRIWLNLELAKKPIECLEYIIVHEMVHLLERNHNQRFKAFMDKFLPDWKIYQKELKKRPLINERRMY